MGNWTILIWMLLLLSEISTQSGENVKKQPASKVGPKHRDSEAANLIIEEEFDSSDRQGKSMNQYNPADSFSSTEREKLLKILYENYKIGGHENFGEFAEHLEDVIRLSPNKNKKSTIETSPPITQGGWPGESNNHHGVCRLAGFSCSTGGWNPKQEMTVEQSKPNQRGSGFQNSGWNSNGQTSGSGGTPSGSGWTSSGSGWTSSGSGWTSSGSGWNSNGESSGSGWNASSHTSGSGWDSNGSNVGSGWDSQNWGWATGSDPNFEEVGWDSNVGLGWEAGSGDNKGRCCNNDYCVHGKCCIPTPSTRTNSRCTKNKDCCDGGICDKDLGGCFKDRGSNCSDSYECYKSDCVHGVCCINGCSNSYRSDSDKYKCGGKKHCCGNMICVDGTCQGVLGATCGGSSCTAPCVGDLQCGKAGKCCIPGCTNIKCTKQSDCCTATGLNPICDMITKKCVVGLGDTCGCSSQCISPFTCGLTGKCCVPDGAGPCTASSNCCGQSSGSICSSNICSKMMERQPDGDSAFRYDGTDF